MMPIRPTILIVEDELIVAKDLKGMLERIGYDVLEPVRTVNHALEALRQYEPTLVLLDIVLRGKQDGIYLAHLLRQEYQIPFVFITSHADQRTVEAAKQTRPNGYLVKPFDEADVFAAVEVALFAHQPEASASSVSTLISHSNLPANLIGRSAPLLRAFEQLSLVAPTDSVVLLEGETGTGKELFARAIHSQSLRKERVMVKINCATLPAQLIESELFGHEKGAFTGAIDKRIGKFELANGGTIFLDEIGEMALELQPKLLRVLQEREFERIGGKQVIKTDVRVIAATNRNLLEEVAAGRFRSDLYYRLNVFPITLPPLRDRKEDVLELATHFGQKFSKTMHRPFRGIRADALEELLAYHWPGNIRELENLVEQAVILSGGQPLTWGRPLVAPSISSDGMPDTGVAQNGSSEAERERIFAVLRETRGKIVGPNGAAQRLGMSPGKLEEYEREFILWALREAKGRVRGAGGAAQLIGIKGNALDVRMARLGIEKEHIYRS